MSTDEERSTRYEGYADFNVVSRNVANSVDDAVDAYAQIQSRHSEGARVKPDLAAEASAHILGAALRLLPELEEESDDVDEYEIIVSEWSGQLGYIERLKEESLTSTCPEWLGEFVIDIRRAAWQLGYLKAGRETDTTEVTWKDGDVSAMFE